MKVLILCDLINNWALHNRAKAIKKFMPDVEFEIRAGLANDEALIGYEQFDIIHFNFSYGLTKHASFILKNKHRCLLTIVNERSYLIGHGVEPDSYKQLMHECPFKTSVGPKMAEMLNAVYIPNGIDEDIFPVKYARTPVVGFSGTDRESKNMIAIVEACKDLGLTLRTANYNNNNPTLPHSRMAEFYRTLDVYVHASKTEGFNNTIIEALACNVPVLMTKEGAWNDFVGYVEFIEPTVEGVVSGLRRFAGRKLIEEKYLWKNIVPEYRKMYEKVYENNKRIHASQNA